jgi:hypothetical protein
MTTDAERIAELVRREAAEQMAELKRHEHLKISSPRKADYWSHPDIRYVVRDTRTGERVGRIDKCNGRYVGYVGLDADQPAAVWHRLYDIANDLCARIVASSA